MISAVNAARARAGTRLLIWAAAAAVLAAVLDFVPLFDLLGYDFSFALGLLTALAAVDIGCGVVAAARRRGEPADVPRLGARAIAFALASSSCRCCCPC